MTEGRWGPEISLKQKNTKRVVVLVGGGWTVVDDTKISLWPAPLTERVKNIPSAMKLRTLLHVRGGGHKDNGVESIYNN